MRRLDTLTSLRFIAAVGVLLTHTWKHLQLPEALNLLSRRGGSGVAFFFVLSGFILTYVYAPRFSKGVRRSQYVEFLRARFARIYPMYVVGLLLMTIVVIALIALYPNHRSEMGLDLSASRMVASWFANLFMIQSYIPAEGFRNFWNAPGWSLVTEAAFYVAFPALFVGLIRKLDTPAKAIAVCVGAVVVDVVLRLAAFRIIEARFEGIRAQQMGQVVEQFFGFRIWEFILGCALAMLAYQTERHERVGRIRPALFVMSILALLAAALTPSITPGTFDLLSIPLFGLLVFAAPAPGRILETALTTGALVLLGEASFSLYITHWPILKILEGYEAANGPASPRAYWALLAVCVGFSLFCFKFIEAPFRDLLRPHRPKSEPPAPTSPPDT